MSGQSPQIVPPRSPFGRRPWLTVILVVVLAMLGAAVTVISVDGLRFRPDMSASVALPGAPPRNTGEPMQVAAGYSVGGPFELIDPLGEAVTETDFADHYMLLFFGYGFCPDVCPTELSNMTAALNLLEQRAPNLAARIIPVFVSVDPQRDTPDVLQGLSTLYHPRLVALTGSAENIAGIAQSYRVFVHIGEDPGDGNYLVDHSSFTYLMAPGGAFVAMFRANFDPSGLSRSLERLVKDRDE